MCHHSAVYHVQGCSAHNLWQGPWRQNQYISCTFLATLTLSCLHLNDPISDGVFVKIILLHLSPCHPGITVHVTRQHLCRFQRARELYKGHAKLLILASECFHPDCVQPSRCVGAKCMPCTIPQTCHTVDVRIDLLCPALLCPACKYEMGLLKSLSFKYPAWILDFKPKTVNPPVSSTLHGVFVYEESRHTLNSAQEKFYSGSHVARQDSLHANLGATRRAKSCQKHTPHNTAYRQQFAAV